MQRPALQFIIPALLLGAVTIAFMGYLAHSRRGTIDPAMLSALWHDFKNIYIEKSTGRILSYDEVDSTSSEDQALTMLRAVWMNDQTTFDRSWSWMRTYLKQKDTNLFSSLYGKRQDGSYGILADRGGQTTVSGANADTALALLFAYARWGQSMYQESARLIMNDMWRHEVVSIQNRPYIAANTETASASHPLVVVNPSSCTFYAYRIFALVDPVHDWEGVLASCYRILEESTVHPLDTKRGVRISPDWAAVNRQTGAITVPPELPTHFSKEALRIPWRLALDWQWFKDERSRKALLSQQFLIETWRERTRLATIYGHDGKVVDDSEDPALYGGTLGYFMLADSQVAAVIRDQKLGGLYDKRKATFREQLHSFDAQWVWLGLALSQEYLPNLLPQTAVNVLREQFIRETPL